jgi:hypothetical protein
MRTILANYRYQDIVGKDVALVDLYYLLKPFIPRRLQIVIRRNVALRKRKRCGKEWPIDQASGRVPEDWPGWPGKKQFALVLTHDVDTAKGQRNCAALAELEKDRGFRSSFNFVPERYPVSRDLRDFLSLKGFEIGVHGLLHDGKLYRTKKIFSERAEKINRYLQEWGAVGFRSPAMHCNLEWIHDLEIGYDASTFDTDPFEAYPEGVGTIFPFLVRKKQDDTDTGYVELPYTLPQDFTLFVLMKERGITVWKEKLDWIAEQGGMALLLTHPDYMNFDGSSLGTEEYPAQYYREMLNYVKTRYHGRYWHVLPRDMARFWAHRTSLESIRQSMQMQL